MSINMIWSQKKNTYFIPCRKGKFGGATLLHHWRFIFQWAFPAKAENTRFTKEDKNQPHFDACLREKKSKKSEFMLECDVKNCYKLFCSSFWENINDQGRNEEIKNAAKLFCAKLQQVSWWDFLKFVKKVCSQLPEDYFLKIIFAAILRRNRGSGKLQTEGKLTGRFLWWWWWWWW